MFEDSILHINCFLTLCFLLLCKIRICLITPFLFSLKQ